MRGGARLRERGGRTARRCLGALAGALWLASAGVPLAAQEEEGRTEEGAATPAARPEDVSSIDAILASVYDVISGGPGVERDWDRFRSLFLPEGRLIPGGNGQDGRARYRVLSVEDYIELAGPQLEGGGFFEREIGKVVERFGNVAHAFSAYASRRALDDPEPFQRGVNGFQLWHDGERWWIVSILWDWERPGEPIPERYIRP